MKAIKKILNNIFIDGLSGMALGLFSTLIIGTILKQIGDLMGGTYGAYLSTFAVIAPATYRSWNRYWSCVQIPGVYVCTVVRGSSGNDRCLCIQSDCRNLAV